MSTYRIREVDWENWNILRNVNRNNLKPFFSRIKKDTDFA